jgi:sugar-specific transcriptional regulator TrmB
MSVKQHRKNLKTKIEKLITDLQEVKRELPGWEPNDDLWELSDGDNEVTEMLLEVSEELEKVLLLSRSSENISDEEEEDFLADDSDDDLDDDDNDLDIVSDESFDSSEEDIDKYE